jgi:hypothetical protein
MYAHVIPTREFGLEVFRVLILSANKTLLCASVHMSDWSAKIWADKTVRALMAMKEGVNV